MKTFEKGKLRVWYDETLLSSSPEQCFDVSFWQQQDKIVGQAYGRGTTWFIQLDNLQGALRHYRRGGLFGRLVRDHYLFYQWDKTRSYQEFQILNHLRNAGVNVPRPIAARAVKKHVCYQADLITEKIPNARDLVTILQENALHDEMYVKIGREIRKMHDAQVNHTDLNIHNILVDEQERVWIIDFDKCMIQPDGGWKEDNISRLKRSFLKEQQKRNICWTLSSFDCLYRTYSE
ncbi:3-deoxy-D-manno-octulosonic acid kinase [Vibrio gazogenes]|uniref:3-deoxy-D-manno-octulosonic acid kinase n=2 Tax=Vibrio gazogenes TaxID=687 RepID=A0A1M5CZC9_VIBGA|nr:3-deoxy-D-manno-octulosonic acid kinase [Vibrio gazogenes]USP13897.1 3-deoxy-D-manno-octulosonic acid kinase [Vibrio gazogenes]SHF60040.1 3-deoxy-D-manno-octulosonic acid kinase [Vibrio gazogenes DSM 21264] [Vibrio gazogenes DSM 21264 = NBRC 103151]